MPVNLRQSLKPDFEAALAHMKTARAQYQGVYFPEGMIESQKCIVENEELKLRGRINTERLYPRAALRNGISGEVVVKLSVDKYGNVTDVEFESASDEHFRDEAILIAFRNARFWPQIKDCATLASTGSQKIVFRMGD